MGVIINIFKLPELRRRVLFTLAMLAVYRFGVFVAVPGVDRNVMAKLVSQQTGGFLGYFNMFSGGALSNLSVFALGIMPYISASIIMQLMTVVIPKLEQLNKEGETGRRKVNQYSRYGTVGLALVQGYFMASWLESQNTPGQMLVLEAGLGFKLMTMLSLTAGTCFLMWLGEQITERGIGNGISLIIYAGIIADMPTGAYQLYQKAVDDPENFGPLPLAILLVVIIAVIAFVVIMERGQRRIPVIYAKRVVGRKMFGGSQNYLPLRINNAGVIPPIFASSIIMFPAQIAGMTGNPYLQRFAAAFDYGNWLYLTVYVALNIFFCYFYTQIQFNPVDLADNLKKQNASIPGIRPGKRTAEYIEFILTRLTFAGSWYISAVCVLPVFLQKDFNVPFYYGGTSLLIVVGVALDTAQQIESHLVTRSRSSGWSIIPAMQTTKLGWTIIDEQAGVLSYSYSFGSEGQANCFTARLPGGGLMVISPPSKVGDEVMDELASFGEVEAIVANNGFHHLGIRRWRERFPSAGCYAAPGAIERISKKSRNAGELRPLAELEPRLGADVAVVEAPTSKCGETWAWAKIGGGYAWYASDILANMDRLPSNLLFRLVFKLSKSAPGYRVFNLAVRFIIKDKKAALSSMLADLRKHPPTVMVPAHGTILVGDSVAGETERLLAG